MVTVDKGGLHNRLEREPREHGNRLWREHLEYHLALMLGGACV